ncbi:MAG: sodium-dependent bicarbonate transport family permease [Pseudomonadota bacterium]
MESLLSPVILFFILGALAAFARSDLSFPEPLSKTLSLYLMCAIGLKGGVLVSENGFSSDLIAASAAGLFLSCIIPVGAFFILRMFAKLDATNAAAVAAHYGSVSVVTFIAGNQILTDVGSAPAGYMIAVLALMETPAIIVGLFLARRYAADDVQQNNDLVRETLLNGSVVLLAGSFFIGLIVGKDGFIPISPVFETGFTGLLCLFLLDMGLVAARRLRNSRTLTFRLVFLGVAFPVINGTIGCLIGVMLGLDAGTATALGILGASASYIAVPAAMRLALPKADPGLYLTMSLAITFPFNIMVGIPLYYNLVKLVV